MSTAGLAARALRWSLRRYPLWWRQRYGGEQEELTEQLAAEGRSRWLLAAGLLAGSFRARMTATGMPPVPALWSSRVRASVVAATIPAALVLPLEFVFFGAVSEHDLFGHLSAPAGPAGAGSAVQWELTGLFFVWVLCTAQLLVAGSHLIRRLWVHGSGRRVTAAVLVAAPVAAVILGAALIAVSGSLRPVVGSWEKNLVTGVTHYQYVRQGHPLAAAAMDWGGWVVAIGGWAAGLLALGRATARSQAPAGAFGQAVSNAWMTALTQGGLVLGFIALEVTLALQAPLGPNGGIVYASRLGPLAIPVLLMLATVAALSVKGAASARTASAQWGRLEPEPGCN